MAGERAANPAGQPWSRPPSPPRKAHETAPEDGRGCDQRQRNYAGPGLDVPHSVTRQRRRCSAKRRRRSEDPARRFQGALAAHGNAKVWRQAGQDAAAHGEVRERRVGWARLQCHMEGVCSTEHGSSCRRVKQCAQATCSALGPVLRCMAVRLTTDGLPASQQILGGSEGRVELSHDVAQRSAAVQLGV